MGFNCFTISEKRRKKKTIRHISSDVTVSKMVMHQFTVQIGSCSIEQLWLMVTLFPSAVQMFPVKINAEEETVCVSVCVCVCVHACMCVHACACVCVC